MAPHLQGRQAGEELHRALHIIEGDAEVLPQAGELGCPLQEKPQKPGVMIIKKMPNRLVSLPVEDAPALWQEHLVLRAGLRAGIDRGLQLLPHLLDHLGADSPVGEVVHVSPLHGDISRDQC